MPARSSTWILVCPCNDPLNILLFLLLTPKQAWRQELRTQDRALERKREKKDKGEYRQMGLSVSQRRTTRLSLSCSQFLLSELQSVSLHVCPWRPCTLSTVSSKPSLCQKPNFSKLCCAVTPTVILVMYKGPPSFVNSFL